MNDDTKLEPVTLELSAGEPFSVMLPRALERRARLRRHDWKLLAVVFAVCVCYFAAVIALAMHFLQSTGHWTP